MHKFKVTTVSSDTLEVDAGENTTVRAIKEKIIQMQGTATTTGSTGQDLKSIALFSVKRGRELQNNEVLNKTEDENLTIIT